MCKICRGENIKGLEQLDCEKCTVLTEIPVIETLKELWCDDCPNLKEIPNIPGLQVLNCSG